MIPAINGRPILAIVPVEVDDAEDWEANKAARWSPATGWHHPKDETP